MDNIEDKTKKSDERIASSSNNHGDTGEVILRKKGLRESGNTEKEEDIEGKVEVEEYRNKGGRSEQTSPNEYLTVDEGSSSSLEALNARTAGSNFEKVVTTQYEQARTTQAGSYSSVNTLTGTEESKNVVSAELENLFSSNTNLKKSRISGSLDTLLFDGIGDDRIIKKKKNKLFSLLRSASSANRKLPVEKDGARYASQDTLTGTTEIVTEEKKKRRFIGLGSSFRKDRGTLSKIRIRQNDFQGSIDEGLDDIEEKSPAAAEDAEYFNQDGLTDTTVVEEKKKKRFIGLTSSFRKGILPKIKPRQNDFGGSVDEGLDDIDKQLSIDKEDSKYVSQDTLVEAGGTVADERKRRGFIGLPSSFHKDKGTLPKVKSRNQDFDGSIEADLNNIGEQDSFGDKSPTRSLPDAEIELDSGSDAKIKKKKSTAGKAARALARTFGLKKLRSRSTNKLKGPRDTPEGVDSDSFIQLLRELPDRPSDDPSTIAGEKWESVHKLVVEGKKEENEKSIDNEEKGEGWPVTTISVVPPSDQDNPQLNWATCTRTSTLPYAVSRWSKPNSQDLYSRTSKIYVKSESESALTKRQASPVELNLKLSILEEKRATFQRKFLESTKDTDSGETIVPQTGTGFYESTDSVKAHKPARHISVTKFDTFSTFDGTFDEDTGVGYLTGFEEDYQESYKKPRESNLDLKTPLTMGPMIGATSASSGAQDPIQRTQSTNQDNASSQNNSHIGSGVGDKREHLYKILVIGELGAGKTSIIKRYVHQFFSQHYRATIGVDFALKVLNWDPHTIIRLQLWDIAGQERFGNMTRVYYKEAVGAFIVFDVTRAATLDAVVKWKQDLDSKVQLPDGTAIPCVLLANKCDQQKEGMVNSSNKMDEYCKEKNFVGWFETSAKENINIEEAARFLVNKILQNDQIMKGNGIQDQIDGERFALNQGSTNNPKKTCAC